MEKLCTHCGVSKNVSMFSKNKNRKDGLQYYCKSCSSKLSVATRNLDKYKKYQDANREHSHLTSIRARAKKIGVSFNLTLEDIVIPECCPVLGMKLERNFGKGYPADNSPSVDRIVPEKGYVKGNVIVISNLANKIKTSATPEQIKQVGEFYDRLYTVLESQCSDAKDILPPKK